VNDFISTRQGDDYLKAVGSLMSSCLVLVPDSDMKTAWHRNIYTLLAKLGHKRGSIRVDHDVVMTHQCVIILHRY